MEGKYLCKPRHRGMLFPPSGEAEKFSNFSRRIFSTLCFGGQTYLIPYLDCGGGEGGGLRGRPGGGFRSPAQSIPGEATLRTAYSSQANNEMENSAPVQNIYISPHRKKIIEILSSMICSCKLTPLSKKLPMGWTFQIILWKNRNPAKPLGSDV